MQPPEDQNAAATHTTPGALVRLSEDDCWELLGSRGVGRVVLVDGQRAEILPVNYVISSGTVVFRTGTGGVLGRGALWGRRVAFEVDRIDPQTERGWSVVVQGELRQAGGPDASVLGESVRPWASGDKPVVATILAESISGRRIAD